MKKSACFLIAALALAAGGCAAAGGGGAPQPGATDTPVSGGQLNMMVPNDPIDWDPNLGGRSDPGEDALAVAYNSLLSFKFGPDIEYSNMILAPGLAERWEVSPDARVYTFHLRQGVKFANMPPVNGRELTAADVKFSIEYYTVSGELTGKKLPESRNEFMFEGLQGVTTPDKYTARVSFKEAFVPFIMYAASNRAPIIPREIYDKDGHFKDQLAGTGPFQLDLPASQRGTRWVFKKNPDYWDAGKPYLNEVRWLVIPSGATALAAFQTKQLDRIDGMQSQAVVEATRAYPEAKTFKYIEPQADKLRVSHVAGQVTADVRVRKAMSLSLDRDEINKVYAGGEGVWGLAGTLVGLFTEDEVRKIYKQDVAEAKRLLAEAGYPNGVKIEVPIDDGRTREVLSLIELMQAQMKRAGITAELQLMPKAEQRLRRRAGAFGFDMSTGSGSADADQDSVLYAEFHSSFGGTTNNSHIKDAELDRLLEAQRREPNLEKRRELQRAAAVRIAEIVGAIGLINTPKWDMVQPYVHNYHPHFSVKAPYIVSWIRK